MLLLRFAAGAGLLFPIVDGREIIIGGICRGGSVPLRGGRRVGEGQKLCSAHSKRGRRVW